MVLSLLPCLVIKVYLKVSNTDTGRYTALSFTLSAYEGFFFPPAALKHKAASLYTHLML